MAAALGVDADLPPQPDPTPPAGDLAADVAAFTTLDACVTAHAKIDPLVGDALLSFGYDTFLRDACRQVEAAKTRDPKRCDPVVASDLRDHCRAVVAMIASAPDDCPFPQSLGGGGREPTCVAVAAHDPRLCAAVPGTAKVTCEAMTLRDPSKCDALAPSDRAACRRTAERLKTSLDAPRTDLGALPAASGKLEVHAQPGTQAPSPESVDLGDLLANGIVVVTSPIETRLLFGEHPVSAAYPHSVAPAARLNVGFELDVAGTQANGARMRLYVLEVPGGVRLDGAEVHGVPKIKIVQLAKERGGPVEFTVDADVGSSPQGYSFHVEAKTFVADVVPAKLAK